MMTLTEALARSLNIPAVRISEAMGRDEVRTVPPTQFGIARTGRGPGAGAGCERIDAAGDDGGLCRHPERRQLGAALRLHLELRLGPMRSR
jgi:hypothetical protein